MRLVHGRLGGGGAQARTVLGGHQHVVGHAHAGEGPRHLVGAAYAGTAAFVPCPNR